MGLFDRLRSMLFGDGDQRRFSEAEIESAERAAAGDSDGSGPATLGDVVSESDSETGDGGDGNDRERRNDGEEAGDDETVTPEMETVDDYLAGLEDPSTAVSRTALRELLEAVDDDPSVLEGRVDELLETVRGQTRSSYGSAVALAALAEANPDALAPYAEDLVECLEHDDEVLWWVSAALCKLARRRPVPVEDLLDALESGDEWTTRGAAHVLGVVAATRPDEIPPYHLEGLYDKGDDAVTRGGAGYVLAILAGERPDEVRNLARTLEEFVELANAITAASDSDGFLGDELQKEAVFRIAADVFPEGVLEGISVVKTPMGTQIVFVTERPDEAVGEDGQRLQRVADTLVERLNLDDLDVHVETPSEFAGDPYRPGVPSGAEDR